MKFLSLKEASDKLTAAGFTVTLVGYDNGVRKSVDLRARRGNQEVTFFSHKGYGPNEIDNAIAGLHKYAGTSFASRKLAGQCIMGLLELTARPR